MSKNTKTQDYDIRKQGPMSYLQLQQANKERLQKVGQWTEEDESYLQDLYRSARASEINPSDLYTGPIESPLARTSTPLGESMFDSDQYTELELENSSDIRAENQPGYIQLANGLLKMGVLAGTTALEGTLGLALGVGEAIAQEDISKLWDNEIFKLGDTINKVSEELFPNYYTEAELNGSFLDNLGTANFWGDKFIKNLGFTVGAFYGGGAWGAIAKGLGRFGAMAARGMGASIKATKNMLKANEYIGSLVGSTTAAIGESGIEAYHGSNEFYEPLKQMEDEKFRIELEELERQYLQNAGKHFVESPEGDLIDSALLEYNVQKESLKRQYDERIKKLQEARTSVGNRIMANNMAVLMPSNLFQHAKLYMGGFKAARRNLDLIRRANKTYEGATTLKGAIAKGIGNAFVEGGEEKAQSLITDVAKDYYATDVLNFFKKQMDPNAEQDVLSWSNSISKVLQEHFDKGFIDEETVLGFMTGALGMPAFGRANTSNAQTYLGKNKAFGLSGGIFGEIAEAREKMAREKAAADAINARIQSPEFQNYYKGLIRHLSFETDKEKAVLNNDSFDFKNAEFGQLVSDIIMFDNINRREDLIESIEESFGISRENLESVVKNTTEKLPDGTLSGRFAEFATLDNEGNIIANFGNETSIKKMQDMLIKDKQDLIKAIEDYGRVKEELDLNTKGELSNEQLAELTWMQMQLDNWKSRAVDMTENIKPGIKSVISYLEELKRVNQEILNKEGQKPGNLTDAYKKADSTIQEINKSLDSLNWLISSENKDVTTTKVLSNPKAIKAVADILEELDSPILDDTKKSDIINKIDDLVRIGEAHSIYSKKLKEYLSNPNKQQEDKAKAAEEVITEETNKKKGTLKDSLNSVKTLKEFRTLLDEYDEKDIASKTLEELKNEGNELAKKYEETSSYINEVRKALWNSKDDNSTKVDANKLFQEAIDNSESIEQLGDINSPFISDEEFFEVGITKKEALEKFRKAQYALQQAILKVNSDNRFKSRFSKGEVDPSENADSEPKPAFISRPKKAVGDAAHEDIAKENEAQNNKEDEREDKSKETKQYYRSSISELHIGASKEGDYRPFDIVAMEKNGMDYSDIYQYLKDNKVFEYLNKGKLSEGAEIAFMIDPTFEEKVKNKSWYTGPIIFMIEKSTGQIVGTLDSSNKSQYEGLTELIDKIVEEYNNRSKEDTESTTEKFIATPITKVDKIMVGKVPLSREEKDLSTILEDTKTQTGEEVKPIFAIMQNGVLNTNKAVSQDDIMPLENIEGKEGRLYILVPNGAGKYSPMAVRVKHFNKEEFNLEDTKNKETVIGKRILSDIEKLSKAISQEDVAEVMKSLSSLLYMEDIEVHWVDYPKGSGIEIRRKLKNPDGTYATETKDGKTYIKKANTTIYFYTRPSEIEVGGISWSIDAAFENPEIFNNIEVSYRNEDIIQSEILNTLLGFNLPFQVNSREINKGNYNNNKIDSDILTSNIALVTTLDNWFTTDYFDASGTIHKAKSPVSKRLQSNQTKKPVEGGESAIQGTRIVSSYSKKIYYVDVATGTIRNENGNDITSRFKEENKKLLIDIAWAQNTYGDSTESVSMINNKVLLPSGRVLDRTKQKYLESKEANEVKQQLLERNKPKGKGRPMGNISGLNNPVIDAIYENQKKVDKSRTDSSNYYILEEDGEYHAYSRVHEKLGDNSTSKRENITGSEDALQAGSAVDSVIRDFFILDDPSQIEKPANMSNEAFSALIDSLGEIKAKIEEAGEKFLTNNIVLFQKYPDGTRVAGEVDILAVDKDGNFKIYDVKTSKYSFYDFNDKSGKKVNYFRTKARWQKMSTADYYAMQLSAYKNLFESQYDATVVALGILPYVIEYNEDGSIKNVKKETGIAMPYKEEVSVPKIVKKPKDPVENTNKDVIFETPQTTSKITEHTTEDFKTNIEGEKTGYFIIDGVLYKSFVTPIGNINGVNVYYTRIPNYTKGFGNDTAHIANYTKYAVFPNGQTVMLGTTAPGIPINDKTEIETSRKQLEGNPQRVLNEANKETFLTKKQEPLSENKKEGASTSVSILNSLQIEDEDSDDEAILSEATTSDYKTWNKEKELAWLKKVLPQLSTEDRLKVVEGLIKVASKGTLAWGMFNKGIITLSDIAAEGTVYHEAFHAVFHLMLDAKDREAFYKEYSSKYNNLNNEELEELMAEDFREFVMQGGKDTRSLRRKILDFFKSLFMKTKHWNKFRPSSLYYFRQINEGKYSNTDLRIFDSNKTKYRELNNNSEDLFRKETQRFLDNFGITINDLEEYDSEMPLFDALNRVINIRNINDLSEGVGYAVAFMMQYNPLITELIQLHYKSEGPFKEKGIRRALNRRGEIEISLSRREEKEINKSNALHEIGKDIATELKKLYNLESDIDTSNSYIKKLWNIIETFFEKLTPMFRSTISIISDNTKQIANAIKLNDTSIIRRTTFKPGTDSEAFIVDIGEALNNNPYEDSIIRTLQNYNIALAGSASIAIEGTLYRPLENPLHDIDFNANNYSKNQLDAIINKEFPYNTHIRTIKDGEHKITETYLILDREFKIEKPSPEVAKYDIIDANTGEIIGNYIKSELTLKTGIKGKFLDFFTGSENNIFGQKIVVLNNREYLISDYRNAFNAKVEWARLKDIWDYNRFVSHDKFKTLEEIKKEKVGNVKKKINEAQIIWGHPAIGKTTYLERNSDIIEWDELINPKRNEFIRNQIDPEHKLDIESKEYKRLRSDYMMNWRNHPEYMQFLTDNWNYLVNKAKRENKKLFASPLPLLEIGAKDINLIVALNNKTFSERNKQRGGTEYSTRGWKQSIDEALVKQDPSKIVYTDKYFSEFIRENLGVRWGTLTKEEETILSKQGWTAEQFDSISQEERDNLLNCIAF